LYEPYVSSRLPGNEAKFGPVTVPKGRLWVMGDNRAQSDDSRYHYVNDYKNDPVLSTVPNGDVIGKAVIIAWPPSRWRTLGTPNTFTSAAASALPAVGAGAAVGPLWLLRRRRRGP
jgi:signal peptidase I